MNNNDSQSNIICIYEQVKQDASKLNLYISANSDSFAIYNSKNEILHICYTVHELYSFFSAYRIAKKSLDNKEV